MLRLFKSFEAQPRLAIVTATLKTAAPDFGHFMLPSRTYLQKSTFPSLNRFEKKAFCE